MCGTLAVAAYHGAARGVVAFKHAPVVFDGLTCRLACPAQLVAFEVTKLTPTEFEQRRIDHNISGLAGHRKLSWNRCGTAVGQCKIAAQAAGPPPLPASLQVLRSPSLPACPHVPPCLAASGTTTLTCSSCPAASGLQPLTATVCPRVRASSAPVRAAGAPDPHALARLLSVRPQVLLLWELAVVGP